LFLFTPNISVYRGQVGEKLNSNSCSWPGANSFPRLCSTSRRDRAKGSRQKDLYCGSRVAVGCPPFFSLLPEHSDPPVCPLPAPPCVPSSPGDGQGVRRQARCGAGRGKHTADMAEGHNLLLLLHILAQIPCPEQWATK